MDSSYICLCLFCIFLFSHSKDDAYVPTDPTSGAPGSSDDEVSGHNFHVGVTPLLLGSYESTRSVWDSMFCPGGKNPSFVRGRYRPAPTIAHDLRRPSLPADMFSPHRIDSEGTTATSAPGPSELRRRASLPTAIPITMSSTQSKNEPTSDTGVVGDQEPCVKGGNTQSNADQGKCDEIGDNGDDDADDDDDAETVVLDDPTESVVTVLRRLEHLYGPPLRRATNPQRKFRYAGMLIDYYFWLSYDISTSLNVVGYYLSPYVLMC